MFIAAIPIAVNGVRFEAGQELRGVRPQQIQNMLRLKQAVEVSDPAPAAEQSPEGGETEEGEEGDEGGEKATAENPTPAKPKRRK